MDEEDIRQKLRALDPKDPEPDPAELDAQVRQQLAGLDPKEDVELEPEPEPQPGELAGVPTTGHVTFTFEEAFLRRNEAGQITELVGDGYRKIITRDEGRPVSIITERQEVVEETAFDSEEGEDEA